MSTRALSKPILSPFVFDDFFKPWNEWFDDDRLITRKITMPSVNIMENGKYYNVSLAAPGLKKDDFNINIDGNILTISCQKEETTEKKDEKFTRKEYNYSSFSRSFTLPEDVKQETIEAHYEDGVLMIRLPRKEAGKLTSPVKKIDVK
jgi:HSP20 family protein